MDKKERKAEIDRCLDEIEAAYRVLAKKSSDKKTISKCKGWARKHKAILKELNYKGKIPRQPKIMKRDEGLFQPEKDEDEGRGKYKLGRV